MYFGGKHKRTTSPSLLLPPPLQLAAPRGRSPRLQESEAVVVRALTCFARCGMSSLWVRMLLPLRGLQQRREAMSAASLSGRKI